jgi:hypothetical protein
MALSFCLRQQVHVPLFGNVQIIDDILQTAIRLADFDKMAGVLPILTSLIYRYIQTLGIPVDDNPFFFSPPAHLQILLS